MIISSIEQPNDSLKSLIKLKRFEKTSSTKLELQTLLWALNELNTIGIELIIYTDSQNITGLLSRRKRLEENNYLSAKHNLIMNHLLYKDFFKAIDRLSCEFVKVQGHKPSGQKNPIEIVFSLVDKASRKAARKL